VVMAAVIHKKGGPDNFLWEEIKIGAPERGHVRLRSTAVGVNFADTYHRAGIPHPMIVGDPPIVVGFEGVGQIEELGPGVTGFSVGERVCNCLPPLGAYSQERLYPADKLIKVPKDLPLDDVQLAGLILKGMTAQYLLHRPHKVQPGDYVLIHAAAGGMGHILCPWARHLGATVIGTVSTDAKAEIARNLGCHHVINYSTEDFVAVTRKITDGKGVDVVYESIGKDTLQRSLDCLRLVGMCAAYGQASWRSRVSHYYPSRAFALHLEPKRNRRRSKMPVRCRRTGGGSEQRCQNLSASGGCSRAQVHRRTQDNGLDRHASFRVSGPKKAGKMTSATQSIESE
jgi:NADPH:quinone reductase-like Zn-dependent oxidoreductase